jgi:signal transduction histidine kinase
MLLYPIIPTSALPKIKFYIAYSRQIKDKELLAHGLFFEGNYYLDNFKIDSAYRSYSQSLRYYQQLNNIKMVRSNYANLAIALKEWGAYDKAIQMYNSALALTEPENWLQKTIIFYNMALLYYNKVDNYENNVNSLKYAKLASELLLNKKMDEKLALTYYQQGCAYVRLKRFDSAIVYTQKALNLIENTNNFRLKIIFRESNVYSYIGLHKYDEAIKTAKEMLEIRNKFGLDKYLQNGAFCLANALKQKKIFKSAEFYYKISYPLFQKNNTVKFACQAMDSLANLYKEMKRYDLQSKIISERLAYSDSVNAYRVEKGIADLYNQLEIENLENNNKNQSEIISKQQTILIISIAFVVGVLIALFAFVYYFKLIKKLNIRLKISNLELLDSQSKIETQIELITKQKEELGLLVEQLEGREKDLELANSSKDKLLSIIAHDLKGPISFYNSTLEVFKMTLPEMDKNEVEEWFNSLIASSKKIMQLLQNLLLWATIQRKNVYFNPEQSSLRKCLEQAVEDISIVAENSEVILELGDDDINANFDSEIVRTIVRNIISNAIKASKKNTKISIRIIDLNQKIRISVLDQGKGIALELLEHINNSDHKSIMTFSQSSGIGLIICKELAELHSGRIIFENVENGGALVSFEFVKK